MVATAPKSQTIFPFKNSKFQNNLLKKITCEIIHTYTKIDQKNLLMASNGDMQHSFVRILKYNCNKRLIMLRRFPNCCFNKTLVNLILAFPTTYALDRPVFANVITMVLSNSSNLKSPYFEVRGCDVEGKYFNCNKLQRQCNFTLFREYTLHIFQI